MDRLSRFIGSLFICTLLFLSCTENKDLQVREVLPEVTTGHVVISPQWSAGLRPEALRYGFYPIGNTAGKTVSVDGTVAGCVSDLPAGTYRMLAYNAGATGVHFAGTDGYETVSVELIATAIRSDGYTLVAEPPEVYAATMAEELTVTVGGHVEGTAGVRSLTGTLTFNFIVENGFSLSKLESTLCGVYPSVLLATGEPTQAALQAAPETAVRFSADFRSATEVTARVRVPGLLDPLNGMAYNNMLNLNMTTTGGEQWISTVDLNSALTQILADNGGTLPVEVPVELDIRIERTAVGLAAKVKGWQVGETSEGSIH